MESLYDRTGMLLGAEKIDILKHSAVAVFGLGGVGSYCAEALARAGIGRLLVCDGDVVAPSNLNRQLYALSSTLGKQKACLARERIADINPSCEVTARAEFITPETDLSFLTGYDYVVDAVDDVPAKLALAVFCAGRGVRQIAAMGCGNRLRPECLYVTDIFKTVNDPLARSVRQKLRKTGVKKLKVVASKELPLTPLRAEYAPGQRRYPGSVSFVPSSAGLLLAKEVVCDLCGL
jgi:tRNA A37 threonylcarbamoyladenosine dehydratase